MLKNLSLGMRSLSAQLILSFVSLVFLTAAAVGLPAMWLLQDQLDHQAWTQVDQGYSAAQALYAAWENEVTNLVTLTAQRPTLHEMLMQRDPAALTDYLDTLRTGAGLDLLLVCDAAFRPLAQAGNPVELNLCQAGRPAGFHIVMTTPIPQVWLLATQAIDTGTVEPAGWVTVGVLVDEEFAGQMRARTGLENTLWVARQPVVTSLAGGVRQRLGAVEQSREQVRANGFKRAGFSLDDKQYYTTWLSLGEPGLEVEMALSVVDIVATQQRLLWTLVGSILTVVALGSFLGALLARRIGQPLARLTEAAAKLSRGDLTTPVTVETQVREVALVAWALEGARIDLKLSLNDLRREKDWTDHLLEAIVEGIVTIDRYGRVTFFSRGAERITGWTRDQALGQICDEIFLPVESTEPFSRLIPPPGRRQQIPVRFPDGRQVVLAITGARLVPPAGSDARVALVFRDVSEEDAVHRLLGHFLANVAHEFRTPLSALAASIELLMDQAPDLSMAELQELLNSLHLGVLGLQTLVDNLLESASIEAGHFRVYARPAQLEQIIGDATRMIQPLLDKYGQCLVVNLPAVLPPVEADSRRVAQVLVNLISNANKYGPEGAEITISATVQDGWIRLTVSDRGPGIPSDYRDNLFRRFVRYGPGDGQTQYGAGLGLSVVKAVIEAHGGQVGIDDQPGGGAVIWFTLPVVELS